MPCPIAARNTRCRGMGVESLLFRGRIAIGNEGCGNGGGKRAMKRRWSSSDEKCGSIIRVGMSTWATPLYLWWTNFSITLLREEISALHRFTIRLFLR